MFRLPLASKNTMELKHKIKSNTGEAKFYTAAYAGVKEKYI
jgi:hypothetical protein